MNDKLMIYKPNDNKQKYPYFVKIIGLDTASFKTNKSNLIKVPNVFEPTNKITLL